MLNKIIKVEGENFQTLRRAIDEGNEMRVEAQALADKAADHVLAKVRELYPEVVNANIELKYSEFGTYYLAVTEQKKAG